MTRKGCGTIGLCCVLLALGVSGRALAGEKQVLDELLDMLRRNEQISEQQYDELRHAADDEGQKDSNGFRAYWKNGIRLDTADKRFRIKIGGRIQNDWAVVAADTPVSRFVESNHLVDFDSTATGTEFRRARLYIAGTVYERFDFKAQYDLAGGESKFKDVYLAVKGLPVLGSVRAGHFKEPFSLEELTGDKYTTFMERGLPNAFAPGRNTGLTVYRNAFDERVTWAVGGFRNTGDFGNGFGDDSEYDGTVRVTALPVYRDNGRELVHVGFSYSHAFRNDDQIRVAKGPDSHLAHDLVDVTVAADGVDLIDPEVAVVFGPFSLQAEYMRAFVDSSSAGNPQVDGLYIFASYFLTGEHRPYNKAAAGFGRITPNRNVFGEQGGCGAWEVAARYSRLDLDSGDASGGTLNTVTAGLNWYLNPNVRVMLNYVFADLESIGDVHVAQSRFQIDF